MPVQYKSKSTRPSVQDKFWFEPIIDWDQRPWADAVQENLDNQPGLVAAAQEEKISREQLVARQNELREDLKFMAVDAMSFEPEFHDLNMSGWPSWNTDMSPPFNPFVTTFTYLLTFDTWEHFVSWYNAGILSQKDYYAALINQYNNTFEEWFYVEGVETTFPEQTLSQVVKK